MAESLRRVYGRLLKGAALLSIMVLAGCASQVNFRPLLSEADSPQAGEGVVVARVINASAYPLPFNQLTLTPSNFNESEEVKLERLGARFPYEGGTTVFSAPIAAGDYALSSIRAFHTAGQGWYSRFVNADVAFGRFTVTEGGVTDLGTLIYYPKPQEDRYVDVLLRLPETAGGGVLDNFFPFYQYSKAMLATWDDDGRDDERYALYASIAQNPIEYAQTLMGDDGTLYFLGKLGIILARASDGEWSLDGVDTNLDLTSIDVSAAGDILLGGAEGRLFFKPAGGDWVDYSFAPEHYVERVQITDDRYVDVVTRTYDQVNLYRSTLQSPSEWVLQDFYTTKTGWDSLKLEVEEEQKSTRKSAPKRIVGVSFLETENSHFIEISTAGASSELLFSNSTEHTFAFSPGNMHVSTIDEEPAYDNILSAGVAKLAVKMPGFWSWTGKPSYFVKAPGGNYEEIVTYITMCNGEYTTSETCEVNGVQKKVTKKSFSFMSVPWFGTETEGLAVVNFSNYDFWSGKSSSETKILGTSDGGKRWFETNKALPTKYCHRFIGQIEDRLLVSCEGLSTDFYESTDFGETWVHVRQQENF